jgi:hypothetical protein
MAVDDRPASPADWLAQRDDAERNALCDALCEREEERKKEQDLDIRRCMDHGGPTVAQNAVLHTSLYEAGVLTSTGPSIENWSRFTAGCVCVTPKISIRNSEEQECVFFARVLTTSTETFVAGMRSRSPTRDEHHLFTFAGLAKTSGMLSESELLRNEPCCFAVQISGVACMINNGDDEIRSGQRVYWAFRHLPQEPVHGDDWADRLNSGDCHPIQVRALSSPFPPGAMSRVFGLACTNARVGEPFAVHICQEGV